MAHPSVKGKSASPAMLADGTVVGAYKIIRRVGVGGMGEVYRARHQGLNKVVALKLLSTDVQDEDARGRFMREGKLASKIQHPHVVDVTDVGEHLGTPFLVMEYLEGEPLSKLLKRRSRLPAEEAVDVMVPTFAAIAAAHAMGVVHRDIKPDNIFMARSGLGEVVPKVLDFGISKAVEDTAPAITMTHAFVGTPHYMSPEQAQGAKRATTLSDQYSLAVVLYEILAGTRPFDEPSFLKLVHSIARGRAVPLRHVRPDVSEGLAAIVARGMQMHAEARFPSVRDMALALLPHASARTRTLWQPRLEALADPTSQQHVSLATPHSGVNAASNPSAEIHTRSEVSSGSGYSYPRGSQPTAPQYGSYGSYPTGSQPMGSHPSANRSSGASYPSGAGHSGAGYSGAGHAGAGHSGAGHAGASQRGALSYSGEHGYSDEHSYSGARSYDSMASYPGVSSQTGGVGPSSTGSHAPGMADGMSHAGMMAGDSGVRNATSQSRHAETGDDLMRVDGTNRVTMRSQTKSRAPWLVVGALALLAGGGLAAVYLFAPPTAAGDAASPSTQSPATQTPAAKMFRVEVAVTPDSASIELDGEAVGTGRFVGELPHDGQLHQLVVSADGYQTQTLGFKDVPPQKEVVLKPAAPNLASASALPLAPPRPWANRRPPASSKTAEPAASAKAIAPNTAPIPTSTSTTGNIDPWKE